MWIRLSRGKIYNENEKKKKKPRFEKTYYLVTDGKAVWIQGDWQIMIKEEKFYIIIKVNF